MLDPSIRLQQISRAVAPGRDAGSMIQLVENIYFLLKDSVAPWVHDRSCNALMLMLMLARLSNF
jgi:hypothetical protein